MLIAILQRGVLRGAEPRRVGKAVGPAGLVAIDGQGNAALLRGHDLLAGAAALLDGGRLRGLRRRIVVGIAVGGTGADRERASSISPKSQGMKATQAAAVPRPARNKSRIAFPRRHSPSSKTKVVNWG